MGKCFNYNQIAIFTCLGWAFCFLSQSEPLFLSRAEKCEQTVASRKATLSGKHDTRQAQIRYFFPVMAAFAEKVLSTGDEEIRALVRKTTPELRSAKFSRFWISRLPRRFLIGKPPIQSDFEFLWASRSPSNSFDLNWKAYRSLRDYIVGSGGTNKVFRKPIGNEIAIADEFLWRKLSDPDEALMHSAITPLGTYPRDHYNRLLLATSVLMQILQEFMKNRVAVNGIA